MWNDIAIIVASSKLALIRSTKIITGYKSTCSTSSAVIINSNPWQHHYLGVVSGIERCDCADIRDVIETGILVDGIA